MVSRRRFLIGLILFSLLLGLLTFVAVGLLEPLDESQYDRNAPDDNRLIQPAENGTELWPYTSRAPTVNERTLAINVIIHGDPDRVQTALLDRTDLDFQELPEDEQTGPDEDVAESALNATAPGQNVSRQETNQTDAEVEVVGPEDDESSATNNETNGTGFTIQGSNVDWLDAHGSTRFTYFESPSGEGQWVDESYQLHAGEYLGQRHHIRAYDDPGENYTAVQIHREYFDFFRMQHTVTDIDDSSKLLEDEFIGEPFVESVNREHHGLRGGRSDGWISSIHLAFVKVSLLELLGFVVLGGVASQTSREAAKAIGHNALSWSDDNWPGLVLALSLIVLVPGIRSAGIAFERLVSDISPQLFAGAVYPLLVFGPLLLVVLFARHLDRLPAFGFATIGLGAAFTLDMMWVGLGYLPIQLVLHRFGLMLALGIFALGMARKTSEDGFDHERAIIITAGLAWWFLGIVMPHIGWV